jgi:hypothetical protein
MNGYDLDPAEGTIESDLGPDYNGFSFKCNGEYFRLGTMDNHFAWDFGTCNCSKHLAGTPVYGMSVGFDGIVVNVEPTIEDKYRMHVYYGPIKCTDGIVRHITIQYGHAPAIVSPGDIVNADTKVAELDYDSVEVEIMVLHVRVPGSTHGLQIPPSLIGLKPPVEEYLRHFR